MSRDERVEIADRVGERRDYCRYLPEWAGDGSWAAFYDYLGERGLDAGLAYANYWYLSVKAGDSYPRIVMPASSTITGNRYWQARDISGRAEKRYQSPTAARGDAIIVVWPKDRETKRSAVVEGPMDALAAAGEGVLGLALMGLTPADESLNLTSRMAYGTIATLVSDNADLGGAAKLVLRLLNNGLTVKLVSPHPHKDLAEAPRHERRRILGLDPEPSC